VPATNRPAAAWDYSVLPLTQDEVREMDADERAERMTEELNRAADLLQAVAAAFGAPVDSLAREIIALTR
jgi:hypothetical protein